MLSRIVMIIAGLCFSTSIAFAQGDAKSNPYLTEMQQTLDKANTKAVSDFNKQFPQPTPSLNENKQTNTSASQKPPSASQTAPQHQPSPANNPVPDIAVTEHKKNEKKDEVVNIFATPGASSSNTNETNTQSQGAPNIFR